MAKANFLVVTPEHRVAYEALKEKAVFKDENGKPKGDPKFGYLALFPNDTDISELKRTAVAAAKAEFGENVDLKTVRFPFKNGDAEADRILAKSKAKAAKLGQEPKKTEKDVAFYRGNVAVKVTSAYDPKVVDTKAEDILDKSKIYSGMHARSEFNFKAVEIDDPDGPKRYVSAYVNFVMKTRDGERMSGKSAKDVFKGLLGGTSQVDPTASSDIDIV